MRPLSFYKKALRLQQQYADGRHIDNALQTNGTLLTDEWCEFLRQNNFLVGVSIDGPQDFHDEYRRNKGGLPSWHKVMRGIQMLRRHGVEWNALAVVNDYNGDWPLEFYRFFRDELQCHYLQFTPVVERLTASHNLAHAAQGDAQLTPFSVSPEQWGNFLCTIFDEWVRHDVGNMFVQIFDATLANWCGVQPGVCTLARDCGHALAMEANGDVFSCDHFVFPDYRIGNIKDSTFLEMIATERHKNFEKIKHSMLPSECRECDVEFACHGECPRNRFIATDEAGKNKNYLCAGYKQYFHHVKPYMDFMRDEYRAERAPANVMEWALKRDKERGETIIE